MPADANLLASRFEFQCGREFELLLLFLCNFSVSGVLSSWKCRDRYNYCKGGCGYVLLRNYSPSKNFKIEILRFAQMFLDKFYYKYDLNIKEHCYLNSTKRLSNHNDDIKVPLQFPSKPGNILLRTVRALLRQIIISPLTFHSTLSFYYLS